MPDIITSPNEAWGTLCHLIWDCVPDCSAGATARPKTSEHCTPPARRAHRDTAKGRPRGGSQVQSRDEDPSPSPHSPLDKVAIPSS